MDYVRVTRQNILALGELNVFSMFAQYVKLTFQTHHLLNAIFFSSHNSAIKVDNSNQFLILQRVVVIPAYQEPHLAAHGEDKLRGGLN